MVAINFDQITVETPICENVEAEYQTIHTNLDKAKSQTELKEALAKWDDLRRRLNSWLELTQLHFSQDTQNESYKQAQDYCDQLKPKLTALEIEMKRRLLNSPKKGEFEQILGNHLFHLWKADVTTFEPVIEADLVQESKLVAKYTEVLALADIEFEGQSFNLEGIKKYTQHPNRDVRYRAEKARWNFFSQNRAELDCLYHELVQLRHGMAKKLGYDNYIDLGYRRMQRIDYSQKEVEQYRNQVAEEVVPLAQKIIDRQAEKLNLDKLYFWDESVSDLRGNPELLGDYDWVLAQVQEMFDEMNQELGDFFRMMVNSDLLDLKTRPAKAGGGFCTSFPTYGVPFIFANFNSTKADLEVLIHEAGHGFQCWQSRNLPVFDQIWPTLESAEIHSMSLELLVLPYMKRFFGSEAERYCQERIAEGILFLPYGVAVDHFQHLVYANPEATPQERHQMWQQLEKRYLPWRRYGELEHSAIGGLWQEKRHIYCYPFYYIDYTLAACCAMQFWVKAKKDYEGVLSDYVALCKRGGEAPFQELVSSARLVSPFKSGCLTDVVEQARQFLAL